MALRRDVWTPERIQALRAKLNLSESELARKLGVGTRTVQRWLAKEDVNPTCRRRPTGSAIVILRDLEEKAEKRQERRDAMAEGTECV